MSARLLRTESKGIRETQRRPHPRLVDCEPRARSVTSAGLNAEDVDLGFKALPEIEIACSEFEPALRLLVDVEAAADFDNPSVIEANLAVLKSAFDLPVHHDIELQ